MVMVSSTAVVASLVQCSHLLHLSGAEACSSCMVRRSNGKGPELWVKILCRSTRPPKYKSHLLCLHDGGSTRTSTSTVATHLLGKAQRYKHAPVCVPLANFSVYDGYLPYAPHGICFGMGCTSPTCASSSSAAHWETSRACRLSRH